jgi:hypothetical protein
VGPCYTAYGLCLSSNEPLPGLLEVSESPNPDIRICWNERPPWYPASEEIYRQRFYTSPVVDPAGRHSISVWKVPSAPGFHIVYDDGTEFFLDSQGTKIWATWPDTLSIEDAAVFLRGPILGFVLRLRGQIPLHASAVDIEGRALLLMGAPGAGKSTTAACFARMGYPLLSDDIVPLLEQGGFFLAQSGYPYVCLWPQSVEALFGSADSLPLITPNWTKRFLSLKETEGSFTSKALPISAICWLDEPREAPGPPEIEGLAPRDGFIVLVGNSYMNYLLDEAMRVKEFEVLGRLSTQIPIRRVRPRQDLQGLEELCNLIQRDLALLSVPSLR